ncbi:MAG: 30S ribosomal protein S16 [Polyangiaceae bacterium]
MAVHIRLSRAGTKKRPFYRLVVTDHRSPRGGKFLENIGTFNPSPANKDESGFKINAERLAFWRGRGALPSATIMGLLKKYKKAFPEISLAPALPAGKASAPKKAAAPKAEKAPAAKKAAAPAKKPAAATKK